MAICDHILSVKVPGLQPKGIDVLVWNHNVSWAKALRRQFARIRPDSMPADLGHSRPAKGIYYQKKRHLCHSNKTKSFDAFGKNSISR